MKKLMVLTAMLGAVNFSGCSFAEIRRGETKPHISFVELTDQNNKATGVRVFAWSPQNNAAVLNKDGKGCVQGADVFNTKDSKIDIGNDILKLLKGITPSGDNSKLIATEITNKITQLKTNTERNSYLSIGMFGLCQLYANGQLSPAELKELVLKLMETSASIVPKIGSPTIVTPTKNEISAEEPKK